MRTLTGKTGFVTGAIVLALGQALAKAGTTVMPGDMDTDALAAAVGSLDDYRPGLRGVTLPPDR